MRITEDKVAIIDYELHTLDNQPMFKEEMVPYIHGFGNLLSGMEKALYNKTIGDAVNVELQAEEAFGPLKPFDDVTVLRAQFGPSFDRLQVGSSLPYALPNGEELILYVKKITMEKAYLTINHPLAGLNLKFLARVLRIRDASDEELQSGFPFGIDGSDKPKSSCSCC